MKTQEVTDPEFWETPIAKAYLFLFNAISDALFYIGEQNYGYAVEELKMAQSHVEETLLKD